MAKARSLRERRSQSDGEPGIPLSGGTIELPTFLQRGMDDHRGFIGELAHIGLSNDDDVLRNAQPGERPVQALSRLAPMRTVRHHNQEV
ncbi:MAG TPA: hypothetical protein VFJ52_04660, partial [Terriglobia bacterium]|nr:hypothetical protein [Terriglobia bacterium]